MVSRREPWYSIDGSISDYQDLNWRALTHAQAWDQKKWQDCALDDITSGTGPTMAHAAAHNTVTVCVVMLHQLACALPLAAQKSISKQDEVDRHYYFIFTPTCLMRRVQGLVARVLDPNTRILGENGGKT